MQLQDSDFIFSDKLRHRVARHVAFWLAFAAFSALIYGSKPASPNITSVNLDLDAYRLAFFDTLSFLPAQVLLSYTFMYLLIPRFLLKGRYAYFIAGLVLAILGMGTTCALVSLNVVGPYRQMTSMAAFYYALMGGLRGGLTITGFAGAIKLAKHWYTKERQNQLLESEKLKAELQILKSQVHPHFLFNTLNNLYSLTLEQSVKAPEVVVKLSGLLRFMLYECNVPLVSLEKEIRFIKNYIELEKLRYGDRLDLSFSITGNPDGKLIAPLLLIPFLENSFKHGASEKLDQAWISIELHVLENKLRFKVLNAVPEAQAPAPGKHGIGLKNVQKRLQLLYPGQHKLKLLHEHEIFMVSLSLNLEKVTMPVQATEEEPIILPYTNAAPAVPI
ncbi:sensor histidine kinase [Pontibacter sp. H249]|uniref:sensor histidine kinase n=1 Tax=Pontibacter sp. H249 TaxID=3133420 RepID=UPI0030BD2707